MMEQEQEENRECTISNKSFPSENLLGHHHIGDNLATSSAKEVVKLNPSNICFQGGESTGYGLRENPKKSWKFSGFNKGTASMQETQCKLCGKEFESSRALFGHMKYHSGRERKNAQCEECGKGFQSLRALTGHMRLHSEKIKVYKESGTSSRHNLVVENLSVRKKRSRRIRYKITQNSSFSSFIESSSATEIEQEVEEVAVCLMMLSRGVRNSGGFNSISDFSDNNSMTFEVKSSHQNKRIVKNEGGNFVIDGDESFKRKKPREEKLDSCVSDSKNVLCEKKVNECCEFDCGIAGQEEIKVELTVPIERFYRGVEFEMLKVNDKSGFVLYDTEIENENHDNVKFKSTEVESGEDLIKEVGLDLAGLDSMKSNSTNKANVDACDAELGVNSCNKITYTTSDSEIFDDSQKKSEFKCKTCNRIFHSYQALGGHQTIHRTNKSCVTLKIENCEKIIQASILPETEASCKLEYIDNLMEREMGGMTVTSNELMECKEYKCPICLKVFASGQALGGHKRVHLVKKIGTRSKQIVMKQEFSDVHDAFDLNLPAMLDEETNGDVGYKSQWAGSNSKDDALVV